MDLVCIRCGEPWDMDYVLHEDPDGFERRGGKIERCPACPVKPPKLSPEQRRRLDAVAALADTLGDDVDGLAATLEDFDLA